MYIYFFFSFLAKSRVVKLGLRTPVEDGAEWRMQFQFSVKTTRNKLSTITLPELIITSDMYLETQREELEIISRNFCSMLEGLFLKDSIKIS